MKNVPEIALKLYGHVSNVVLSELPIYKLAAFRICIFEWNQFDGNEEDNGKVGPEVVPLQCAEYIKRVGRKTLYGFVMLCYITSRVFGDSELRLEAKIRATIIESHPRVLDYPDYHEFVLNAYTSTHLKNHEAGLHALIYDYILNSPKMSVGSIFDQVRVYAHMFHWKHQSLLGENFQRLARHLYDAPTVVFMMWLAWRYFTFDKKWLSIQIRVTWMKIAISAGFDYGIDTENRFLVEYFNSHLGCEFENDFDLVTEKRLNADAGFIKSVIWNHAERDTDYQLFFDEIEIGWKLNREYILELNDMLRDYEKFGDEAEIFATNHVGELHVIASTFWMYVSRHESLTDLVQMLVKNAVEQVGKVVENTVRLISVGDKPAKHPTEDDDLQFVEDEKKQIEDNANDIISVLRNRKQELENQIYKLETSNKQNKDKIELAEKEITSPKQDGEDDSIERSREYYERRQNDASIEIPRIKNENKRLADVNSALKGNIVRLLDLPNDILSESRKNKDYENYTAKDLLERYGGLKDFYNVETMKLLVGKSTNQNGFKFNTEVLALFG